MSTADVALLERWRTRRDADAFAEIVARHSGVVYATCRRVLGNAADAEDVAQECFVELMGTRAKVRSSLPAWLHTMALHRSLDRLKKEKRRREREKRYADGQAVQIEVELDDVLAHIDEAIAELPAELREPIIHRFLEGQTHEAIAQTLGSTESTVRYRLNKGVEQVRAALKKRGVSVSAAGLAGILAAELSEAAPAALTARLGKLSVAGLRAAVQPAGTAVAAGVAAFLGQLGVVKTAALAVALVALTGLGLRTAMDGGHHEPSVTARSAPQATSGNTATPLTSAQGPGNAAAVLAQAPSSSGPVTAQPAGEGGGVVMGRIYDAETGKGIEGVRFHAFPPSGGAIAARSEPSDTPGAYRLTGLPAGSYTVSPERSIPGYPDEPFGRSLTIEVTAAKPTEGVDFAIKPGIRVSGIVLSADGKPVAKADVLARTEHMVNPAHAETRDDGTFDVSFALPSSTLLFRASTGKFTSPVQEGPSLPKEGLAGIELRLTEPKASNLSGVVRDPAGAPIAKANVHLSHVEHGVMAEGGFAIAEANGAFLVKGLPAGTYSVSVTPPDVTLRSTADELTRVELAKGEALNGVELVYGENGGLAIAGRVVDTGGKPIPKARVSCWGTVQEVAHTDEVGAFLVTGLEEGLYSLQASHDDYTFAGARAQAGVNDVTIVMKGRAGIAGRVVSAPTGEPIAAFEVSFINGVAERVKQDLFGNARKVEDPEGRFAFDNVYAIPVTVSARAPGFAPAFVNLSPVEHETISGVELRLDPVEPFAGRVVDSEGNPVPNALIFLDGGSQDLGGIERRPLARTGPDGSFELDSLSPEYTLVGAYYPDFAPATAPVSGDTVIVLPGPGSIRGTVTADGQAIEQAGVYIRYAKERDLPYKYTVATNGTYAMGGVAPGIVTVWTSASPGLQCTLSRDAVVESGGTTNVDLHFQRGAAVMEGIVTLDGGAAETAHLSLKVSAPECEYAFTTLTGAGGAYRFEGIPAGTATLKAALIDPATGLPSEELEVVLSVDDGAALRQDFDFSN